MFRFFGTWQLVFLYTLLLSPVKPIDAQSEGGNLAGSNFQDDYYYGDPGDPGNSGNDENDSCNDGTDNEDEFCNQHAGESEDCDPCHQDKFQSMPKIKDTYGDVVSLCCNRNRGIEMDGYIFKDDCEVCTNNKFVISFYLQRCNLINSFLEFITFGNIMWQSASL